MGVEEETSLNGEKVNMKRIACINKELKPKKVKLEDVQRLNKEFDDLPTPVDNKTIFKLVFKVPSVLDKKKKNSSEKEEESFKVKGETSDLNTRIIGGETPFNG